MSIMSKVRTRKSKYKTDLLFPRTSFLVGMGSILNVGGNYFEFNYSKSAEEADSKALENDWGMIAQDIEEVSILSKEEDS